MRSLRGRLTLGVLLVLAVVLTGAGVATSRAVEQSELDAVDDRLQRTAELSRATAVAAVQEALPDADDRLDAVLDATRTSLRLTLAGRPLLDTGAPPRSRPRLRQGLQTFTASDGQRYRAYVTTLRDAGLGGLVRLEVTSSLAAAEARQRRFDRRLALSGLVTLLVTGAGVWLGGGVVLRPLRRLRAVASRVAEDEDLTRRVPVEGPAEVRSVAASLNAMLARLQRSADDRERALAATRRFAADAGHELRTPLTAVQATLSALQRHPDLDAERRVAMAGDALAEQRRLVALLDGLQALARGDARPGAVGDVDLVELVDEVIGVVSARHPRVALACSLPDGALVVRGWEPGLRVLVENLVENAVRHGAGEDGTVRVALARGAGPVLTVEDDGPGVPAGERERIFAPFARLGDGERPGSGLGLALVAQQAGHHGASVEVGDADPALGGARFTVRFPPS